MALATLQVQASSRTVPLKSLPWKGGGKFKHLITTIHVAGQKDRVAYPKSSSCLRIGAPCVLRHRKKPLKVLAFKGNGQTDDSSGRVSRSKSLKDSVKISYVPKESGEAFVESSEVQCVHHSDTEGTISGSQAIQRLFRSWLMLLRMPTPNQAADGDVKEESIAETLATQDAVQKKDRGEILKAVWCYFLGLDATVKIPLVILVVSYLAVTLIYGAEASRGLTPVWVYGPLIVALYIKLFQGLCALYLYTFKQAVNALKVAVKAIMDIPALVTYVAQGKLKEDILMRYQSFIKWKNDYQKKRKEHLEDKYMDFLESIWPRYFKIRRFLKRAKII